MRPSHILIVDDHMIFRKSLIQLISSFKNNFFFSEASNGLEALERLESSLVDLIILDVRSPVMNRIEFMKKMKEKCLKVPVIVLTQLDEKVLVAQMMQLGASAYLIKNCKQEELEKAIMSVLKNGFYQTELSLEGMRLALGPSYVNLSISPREREMIALFKEGMSNKEIAKSQSLTLHTVETYRKAILKKMRCKNVPELISLAYRTGLL